MQSPNLVFGLTGINGIEGGIAGANRNILHALVELVQEKGGQLTILSFLEKMGDRPDFLPASVRFIPFQGKKSKFSLNLLWKTFEGTTFIFDHVRLTLPLLPFLVTKRLKTVIFAHGSESWKRIRRTSQWSFRQASLCIANSHFTLRKMCERIPHFNGVTCPLGLSPEFPLNEEFPRSSNGSIELEAADGKIRTLGKQVLLLVGRMDQREGQKGHRPLIQILPKLLERFPDVQLVFPGPGEDRKNLRVLAKGTGVASQVFLPGWVPVTTLQSLYHHCYAYVMPSQQEGFGLAYLEAMNYGKACVGCRDQGAEDIIVHGETGFLIQNPENPRELLDTLRLLLKDPGLNCRLGEKGFERLHRYFTARHHQDRVKKFIGAILE